MTQLEQRTLQVAKRSVGQREATGRNDGPFVRMLQRWAAKGAKWMDNQPWCVAFATHCIAVAAKELGVTSIIPERTSSSRLFKWYQRRGQLLQRPHAGCVGMLKGGATGHSHTFLVHTVEGGEVITIEGNWRNAVGWGRRPMSSADYGPVV